MTSPSCRKTGGIPGLALEDRISPITGGAGGHAGKSASNAGIAGRMEHPEPSEGGAAGQAEPDPSLAGTGGAGEPLPPVFSRAALLGAFADCALSEAHAFEARAEALVSQAEAHVMSGDESSADALRTAWVAAMDRFQRLELFQFGPLGPTATPGGRGLRTEIYSWPSFNRCDVDQLTLAELYNGPNFARSLSNRRGLAAIEYLAFYSGSDNGCAETSALNRDGTWLALDPAELRQRKARYAHAAAFDVLDRARTLVDAWHPESGNFWQQLTSAGTGSATYPTLQSALNAVSDALFYMDTEVKDMKVAWPLGIGACSGPCPSVAEAPFAGRSKQWLRNNLIGFRLLFEGCTNNGAGLGFDDLLIEVGQDELADAMRRDLARAIGVLDALEQPTIEAAVAADPNSVFELYAAIKEVTDALKVDFVSVLDLARPMGAEGDND